MAVNQVTLANGDELINLTNDTVSELSLLSGATAHDASGEQIVGKAQYINPNLLINPDFKINQRGQSEYGSSSVTVDMWRTDARTRVEVLDSGNIRIIATGNYTDGWWALFQFVENLNQIDIYTVSVKVVDISGDSWHMATESDIRTPLVVGVNTITDNIPFSGANGKVGLALNGGNAGDYVELEWIKLELGTVATPYVDPDEALELVRCQRYYKELTGLFPISIMTNDLVYCDIPIGDMRITPTASFKTDMFNMNKGIRVVNNSGSAITGFEFRVTAVANTNDVEIIATKEGHGLSRNDALICVDIDNPVCLSAEP